MTKYKLTTDVVGNPDYGQDPHFPPYDVENTTITATTFQKLRDRVYLWQLENQIGGGNWKPVMVFKNGDPLGKMSYNGCTWEIGNENIQIML